MKEAKETCAFCGRTVAHVIALEQCWEPSFWLLPAEVQVYNPVCPSCMGRIAFNEEIGDYECAEVISPLYRVTFAKPDGSEDSFVYAQPPSEDEIAYLAFYRPGAKVDQAVLT